MSTTSGGKKRMEAVTRDFHAAITIRRCVVMEKRPKELTRANFVEQPLSVEFYGKKMKSIAGGRPKKTVRRQHGSIHLPSSREILLFR